MGKSKFVKSTIILLIGGAITKVLGMFIRIVLTRLIGTEGIGLYMLVTPTFMLFIALAQLGFPVAISTLVASNKKNNKNLVLSIVPIALIINIIVLLIIFFCSKFLATNLLHEERCYYALMAIGFVLPFISISSIMRGYFFGKEKMFPHVLSNICEDILRLIVLSIGIPYFLKVGIEYAVAFVILSNIFSELISITILFIFLPKKFSIKKEDFIPKKQNIKDVFNISIPATGSRIIGSIGSFLEPIILTFILLKVGYSNDFMLKEYGILNGYVMPLLLMPSFFTMAISQALIPTISNAYYNNNKVYAKYKLKQAIMFSLMVGIPITIAFELIPNFALKFIYDTNEGVTYLKVLAPIFLIFYVQAPLTATLQAMGKAKEAMTGTLEGIILKTILLIILTSFKIGMYGLIIACSVNIIYVTYHQYTFVKKYLET